MPITDPSVALVLGSGGARGIAHVGVLKAMHEHRIAADMVVGTSIGAFVGGLYAAGVSLRTMEKISTSVDKKTFARLFFPKFFGPGMIDNARMLNFIGELVGDIKIEDLDLPFSAVTTDFITGRDVVIDRGPLKEAILASMALPAIFPPVRIGGTFYIDGGLSNPLPLGLPVAMGAKSVIAVNVSPDPRRITKRVQKRRLKELRSLAGRLPEMLTQRGGSTGRFFARSSVGRVLSRQNEEREFSPSMLNVIAQSILISTHSLIRQSLQQHPPHLLIEPKIGDFELLEFSRGAEIMRRGYEEASRVLPMYLENR